MNSGHKIKNFISKFKDLTTLGLTNITTTAIAGIFWLYMAGILGADNYGHVTYYMAGAGTAIIFSSLGSSAILTVYRAKDVKIQATIYFITICIGIISSVILFLIYRNFAISLYILGNIIFSLAIAELLGQKLYKKYSIYLVAQKILMVILAIAFYYLIGPNGVILGIGLSMIPSSIRIYHGFRESKIDFSLLKPRFGFIINSYFLDISRNLGGTLDKLIVQPMLGFELLGNYQLGLQFFSILNIIPGIVYAYILPQDASGNPNKGLKKIIVLASIGMAILGIILSPLIVPLLFPKYIPSIQVIQIMSTGVIPGTISMT